jgi:hypothetical protein
MLRVRHKISVSNVSDIGTYCIVPFSVERVGMNSARSCSTLFSFISQNWRGKPLVSHEVIVNLISATTTQTGLKVRAKLDTNSYPPGAKVSKKQIAGIE